MNKNDGGPAFPTAYGSGVYTIEGGMSLRDWFAGVALSGWLASFGDATSPKPAKVAEFAYHLADAMLAEREKRDE